MNECFERYFHASVIDIIRSHVPLGKVVVGECGDQSVLGLEGVEPIRARGSGILSEAEEGKGLFPTPQVVVLFVSLNELII